MTPTLGDVLTLLEKIAPHALAESWDNPGLQVGSAAQKTSKIFVALDPTIEALASAAEHGAQLLLTHHPLIFRPLKRLDTDVYPGNVIARALECKVAIACAHTNLDAAQGGINDILAQLLSLTEVEVLKENETQMTNEMAKDVGIGRVGYLRRPEAFSAVAERVKHLLGTQSLKAVGDANAKIHRVAVVGGSGGSMVALAAQRGADLLLTGDVGYHHALKAESLGLAVLDGGHFLTEKKALELWVKRLRETFRSQHWQTAIESESRDTDPMRFV
jgi:dinuclear metal center YbgI/SA1388 family protein